MLVAFNNAVMSWAATVPTGSGITSFATAEKIVRRFANPYGLVGPPLCSAFTTFTTQKGVHAIAAPRAI